ncbi:uncharacterized protein PG998_003889 [Apiospora kogelbergensis]|uniref:Uncharacterized protein n=1 Tax=Apiospora kogelbergensis TaxID=1337665 RepID=A0AAW0QJD8_9PEZI
MRVALCRSIAAILLAASLPTDRAIVEAYMKFIEPPEGGLPGNYTGNSQYAIGEKIEISWVEGNMAQQYNLVMFQNWNSNSEIIQRGLPGEGKYSWVVGTSKNVEASNVFYFELQVQLANGDVRGGPTCHYFNILNVVSAVAPVIGANSGSAVPMSPPSMTTTTTACSSGTLAASTGTREPGPAGGMSTSAKLGLGVAIPTAILVGVLMGWLLFRRCQRASLNTEGSSSFGTGSQSERGSQSEQGCDKQELPALPRRTVEWVVKSELPG